MRTLCVLHIALERQVSVEVNPETRQKRSQHLYAVNLTFATENWFCRQMRSDNLPAYVLHPSTTRLTSKVYTVVDFTCYYYTSRIIHG